MLFGVYDGHGGPRCAKYLEKYLPQSLSMIKDIRHDHEIAAICAHLDRDFLKNQNSDDGSTACVILAQWWDKDRSIPLQDLPNDYNSIDYPAIVLKLLAINVGDSRATIIKSDCAEAIALTKDHKPTDPFESQRIYDAGGYVQSNRVDGSLALSRSFGDKQFKQNESQPFNEQKVICTPDITTHYLTPGEMLIITCDGLFEAENMDYPMFSSITKASKEYYSSISSVPAEHITSYKNLTVKQFNDINNLVKNSKKITNIDTAGIARDLIVKSHEYGSKDNHTCIVIHFNPIPMNPIHPDGYEYIPGPCHSLNPDTTFLRCYRTDINPDVPFDQVIPRISATDYDYMGYCHWRDLMEQFMAALIHKKQHLKRLLSPDSSNSPIKFDSDFEKCNDNRKKDSDDDDDGDGDGDDDHGDDYGHETRSNSNSTQLEDDSRDDDDNDDDNKSNKGGGGGGDDDDDDEDDGALFPTEIPISSQSSQLIPGPNFDENMINLNYPLVYFGQYLPTGSTLMPFYFPMNRTLYPEWLDAFIQHSLSRGDDCDYY
jgi:serine/threonine protein phosphatase PrpC